MNFRAIIGIRNDVITLEDLTTLNISRSKKVHFIVDLLIILAESIRGIDRNYGNYFGHIDLHL